MPVVYLPLSVWNRRWKIEQANVRCTRCGRLQPLTRRDAFEHAPGCQARVLPGQYPGQELAVILEQKRKAGLM